jgi:lysophospholipid acyltransferase (LPLAT)-like uncharacterized protein
VDEPRPGDRRRLRDLVVAGPGLWLGVAAIRLLGRSLRFEEIGREHVDELWAHRAPVIYAVWHGQVLMLPYFYGRRRPVHVLASHSRDGELLSRFVERFGIGVVRGSSSRGGAVALRGLARVLRRGGTEVLVAPDGPRGPRHVVQPGVVSLAGFTAAPIVPMAVGASRGTVLGSWDRFVVPHPFARLCVAFGEPLYVPRQPGHQALETARRDLEGRLSAVTRAAGERAGARGVLAG